MKDKDPAFLFYPGDYLRDTQCLSAGAQVAYDRIMCEHMRNICIPKKTIDFFTKRLTPDEKEEILFVLEQIEGGYCIPWVVRSIEKRREYSEGRKKNRAGGNEKTEIGEQSHDTHGATHAPVMENENANGIESKTVIKKASKKKLSAPKGEQQEAELWPTFSDFWELGLPKVDKERAVKYWKKVKQKDREAIMEYVPRYIEAIADKRFMKGAPAFLNQKAWNNEIIDRRTAQRITSGIIGANIGISPEETKHRISNYSDPGNGKGLSGD